MKPSGTDTIMEKQLEEEMKQGIAASEEGDKATAERVFRGIVERDPDAIEAWVWLGWTSADPDNSEAAFRRASELDPSNEEAQLGLRWVASQREEGGSVAQPPHGPSSMVTGALLQTTAPQLNDRGAPADPDGHEEKMREGIAAAQAGDKAGAYAIFKELTEMQPDSPDIWTWLGGTASDLDEAENAFKRAAELTPDHEGATLGLRWVALRRRALEEMRGADASTSEVDTNEMPETAREAEESEMGFFAKLLKRFTLKGVLLLAAVAVIYAVLLVWVIVAYVLPR
jgi:tetratricopeptide (TPR) repeat protein